jgi:hypothetical protein
VAAGYRDGHPEAWFATKRQHRDHRFIGAAARGRLPIYIGTVPVLPAMARALVPAILLQ